MGYDLGRFLEAPDEELVCPICGGVLEDAVQAPRCEHAFCRSCIGVWLAEGSGSCPADRGPLLHSELGPVPRILRNYLARLRIHCRNKEEGCQAVLSLELLRAHEDACEWSPSRPTLCLSGCGLSLPPDAIAGHSCVEGLKEALDEERKRAAELEHRLEEQTATSNAQAREILSLKTSLESALGRLRTSNRDAPADPSGRGSEAFFDERVSAWAASLPRARVEHWGRLISTPDFILQSVIRRSLADTGCHPIVSEALMEASEESGWPPGLRSLELRQINRPNLERFLCRRLPGNQAVLLLSCENGFVPEDLLPQPPGIIMIFANGVQSLPAF